MTELTLDKTVNLKIGHGNQTGYYCPKNGEYPKNRANSKLLELKRCKV